MMGKCSKAFRILILGIVIVTSLLAFTLPASQVAALSITLYPNAGPAGTVVTIEGTDFTAYQNTYVYVFFQYTNIRTILVPVGGYFAEGFTVPSGFAPGSLIPVSVWTSATYGSGTQLATVYFTFITEPVVTVNPSIGLVGSTATVSGTGFALNSSVTIEFDNVFIASAQSNASGSFSGVTFAIPESAKGAHVIRARDASSNNDTITFNTNESMAVTPTSGMVGDTVTVRGTGFRANMPISITYKGAVVSTNPSTVTSSSTGSFSATFVVSAAGSGTFQISVSDGAYTATANFTTSVTMSINKTSGPVGTDVTVSGRGFQPRRSVSVTFDGTAITDASTDETGSFSYRLIVPPAGSGVHKIVVSDNAGNTKSADFTVTFTASFSAGSGFGGSKVTVTGNGFAANSKITITFDGKEIATGTTDATGNLTKDFNVPPLAKGTYKMEVSDGVNKKSADFTITTTADINKTTGSIGTEVTASGIGFTGTVTVKYDANTVATATPAATGEFSATFKVPASLGGAHTITITDGVNTVQKTFTMETDAPPVPNLLLPLSGEKAPSETIFDWSDVSDPSGVTYTLQVATDSSFSTVLLEKKGLKDSTYAFTKTEEFKSTKKDAPYYWRVRAIDGASNQSAWSTPFSFYLGGFGIELPTWAKYLLLAVGVVLVGFIGFLLGKKAAYSY